MYSSFIHLCYLCLLAILATPAASLPATLTDDDSLPRRSSSPAGAVTATHPHTSHALHLTHHSRSHAHTRTHAFLNPSAVAPTMGLTSPHDTPSYPQQSSQKHKDLTVIIFASIGGVVGIFFLALCARLAIAHTRTPRHNTVLTAAERAQLVQEIAEYAESASRRQCHSLTGPPPPPYEHAPCYDSLTPHGS